VADVEVLAGGRDRSPRPGGRRGPSRASRRLLLVLVAVLVLVGWRLDAGEREREADALVAEVAAGERSARWASARVRGAVQYASPAVVLSSTPPGARRDLAAVIERAAAQAAGVLREDAGAVRALPVRGWHDDVRRARDAYAQHLELRAERYDAVARDALADLPPDDAADARDRARRALVVLVGRDAAAELLGD
jgi:hypothetical protein